MANRIKGISTANEMTADFLRKKSLTSSRFGLSALSFYRCQRARFTHDTGFLKMLSLDINALFPHFNSRIDQAVNKVGD